MKWIDNFKKFLIKLHEWEQQQWMIVSIFLSTSSIWFSLILSFFGETFRFVSINNNGKRQFTVIGFICTFIIIIISCLFAAAQRYYEYNKFNSDINTMKLFVLEQVDLGTNKICDNKFITLKKLIYDIKKTGNNKRAPIIVSKPEEQLKHITERMSNCLSKLLSQNEYDIREDELYISVYYNFPLENNNWNLADSLSPEKGLDIDALLNRNTTFAKILESNKTLLFYNSKEQAQKYDCYISDSEDKYDSNNRLKGSIVCYKIIIKEKEQVLAIAVVSISTYNKKFVNSDDKKVIETAEYNINEYIFKPFEKRMRIELCLLYLSKLHNGNL